MTRVTLPAVALLAMFGCGQAEHKAAPAVQQAPVQVHVASAANVELPSTYEATGTVRARTSAVLAARVMGYVREVRVQAGDRVEAGQLLVLLDARDLETSHRQAEAALNEARNAIPEVTNAVAAAKAQLDLAQTTFERMRSLYEKKSISNQEFDEASARLQVARAQHEMALAKRTQLTQKIQQAEAGLEAAAINRGYAEIKAPFAGVVTDKRAEPGALAAPGVPLVTIEQAGAYRLEAAVEESRMPQIRIGQPVVVVLEALNRTFAGRVNQIEPAVDAAARAFTVKIDLPALAQLRSGMFGRARFTLGRRTVLVVPAGAIVERGQVQSVFIVDNGVARNRLVTIGQKLNDQAEVLSGLAAGDKVVSPVLTGLEDGAKVEVRQ